MYCDYCQTWLTYRYLQLFSQIDAICPNQFGSWWTYTAHFCDAKIQHFGKIRKRNVE